jgi:hypothetical protein
MERGWAVGGDRSIGRTVSKLFGERYGMSKYAMLALLLCVWTLWWGGMCYSAGENDWDGFGAVIVAGVTMGLCIVVVWALVVEIYKLLWRA